MMDIRFPFINSSEMKKHPLYVGFKIDHYIGPVYDRKTSEILLEAKKRDCFIEILGLFEMELEIYEANIVEKDFLGLFLSSFLEEEQASEKARLKILIDSLYKAFQSSVI
ncbi:hypothetical protein D3C77_411880 [compost metagenome]